MGSTQRASLGSHSRGFLKSVKRSRREQRHRDVPRGPGADGTKAQRQLINYCKKQKWGRGGRNWRSCLPIIFLNRKNVLACTQIAPWEALSLPNCS